MPYYNRLLIIGTQKETIILTTTYLFTICEMMFCRALSFGSGWSMLGVGASCVQGRFGLRMFSLKVAVKVSGSNALSALLGQWDFFCLCVCVCVA